MDLQKVHSRPKWISQRSEGLEPPNSRHGRCRSPRVPVAEPIAVQGLRCEDKLWSCCEAPQSNETGRRGLKVCGPSYFWDVQTSSQVFQLGGRSIRVFLFFQRSRTFSQFLCLLSWMANDLLLVDDLYSSNLGEGFFKACDCWKGPVDLTSQKEHDVPHRPSMTGKEQDSPTKLAKQFAAINWS